MGCKGTTVEGLLARCRELEARCEVLERELATAQEQQAEMRQLALEDSVTGLFNARVMREMLELEFARASRYSLNLSVIIADPDDFKRINQAYGDRFGNAVLKKLANFLQPNLRRVDGFFRHQWRRYRFGGDEFVIILPITNKNGAVCCAERLRRIVEESAFRHRGKEMKLTMSFGIASYPADTEDMVALFQLADRALNKAKKAGKNRVCAHS